MSEVINVNKILMGLEDIIKCPVAPDEYTGKERKYIVFSYDDERGSSFGDNEELTTTADISVTMFCPASYNYFSDKKKIKNALMEFGFEIVSINSFLERIKDAESLRHLVFDTTYTISQKEGD